MSQKKTSAYNVFQRTTPKKNNNDVEIADPRKVRIRRTKKQPT